MTRESKLRAAIQTASHAKGKKQPAAPRTYVVCVMVFFQIVLLKKRDAHAHTRYL